MYRTIQVSSGFIISPLTDNFISLDSQDIGEEAMSDEFKAIRDEEAMRLKRLHGVGGLRRLDNLACINTYAKMFQTQGSLLLVVTNSTSIVYGDISCGTFDCWVCNDDEMSCELSPSTNDLRAHPAGWQPGSSQLTVSYCLSEPLPEECKVHLTLHLAVVVTALSLIKAVVIISLSQRLRESPLVTIGDAVASFLSTPEPSTKDMCLVSKQDVKKAKDVWPNEDTLDIFVGSLSCSTNPFYESTPTVPKHWAESVKSVSADQLT
ncbi:uncharacterized protein yc1106_05232 [Curvularia clavata]|uniref:Uncharacterized protein n=1 Tax=Curvularia clavata TaxID=95742 RepID=A0A9Q8ZCU9_CURCL|nr:uncharacterized protein yc1106_05232 [Curvularia clavata]